MPDQSDRRSCLPILLLICWLLITAPVLAAAGVVVAHELRYTDRIYQGVRVGNVAVGGLTLDEAGVAIRSGLPRAPGAPITLHDGDRSWNLTPADLKTAYDVRSLAAQAFAVGRQSSGLPSSPRAFVAGLQQDFMAQYRAWREGYVITPTLTYDDNRLAYVLKQIAREVDLPPREGVLTISGLEVTGTPGAAGRLVDLEATRAAVTELLLAGKGGAVTLAAEERQPVIKSVDEAAARAREMLSQPLTLVAAGIEGDRSFSVERATLADWLRFSALPAADGTARLAVRLDGAQLNAFLKETAGRFDRPAQDAVLDFDRTAKQVTVVSASSAGQKLEVQAAARIISATVLSLAPGADISRAISLPVTISPPKVDSTKVGEMGIVELVSEGTTYFAGSSRERVQNIVAAAAQFRHVVVPPDEEFSFNAHVGEINAANGFVDSLVIWGDRTAVGIGGGVCQVSTTAFRAAFFGGFPITERWAHGYVVSWYGEVGLDATIYTPDVDFRFRNDTGHYLLIKAEVDAPKGRITYYIYGTKPDRTVEASKPVVSNTRSPEKPIYQEDPTLARGVIQQVDWAKNGMDVVVKRTIRYGDGTTKEEDFVSKYQPWRSVYLVGPGASLPADAVLVPAATATPTPRP